MNVKYLMLSSNTWISFRKSYKLLSQLKRCHVCKTLDFNYRPTCNIARTTWKCLILREWQQNFLSSPLKETPKPHAEVYYRIFIFAVFRDIFWLEVLSCPPSWIFVDMHHWAISNISGDGAPIHSSVKKWSKKHGGRTAKNASFDVTVLELLS